MKKRRATDLQKWIDGMNDWADKITAEVNHCTKATNRNFEAVAKRLNKLEKHAQLHKKKGS